MTTIQDKIIFTGDQTSQIVITVIQYLIANGDFSLIFTYKGLHKHANQPGVPVIFESGQVWYQLDCPPNKHGGQISTILRNSSLAVAIFAKMATFEDFEVCFSLFLETRYKIRCLRPLTNIFELKFFSFILNEKGFIS